MQKDFSDTPGKEGTQVVFPLLGIPGYRTLRDWLVTHDPRRVPGLCESTQDRKMCWVLPHSKNASLEPKARVGESIVMQLGAQVTFYLGHPPLR